MDNTGWSQSSNTQFFFADLDGKRQPDGFLTSSYKEANYWVDVRFSRLHGRSIQGERKQSV